MGTLEFIIAGLGLLGVGAVIGKLTDAAITSATGRRAREREGWEAADREARLRRQWEAYGHHSRLVAMQHGCAHLLPTMPSMGGQIPGSFETPASVIEPNQRKEK